MSVKWDGVLRDLAAVVALVPHTGALETAVAEAVEHALDEAADQVAAHVVQLRSVVDTPPSVT